MSIFRIGPSKDTFITNATTFDGQSGVLSNFGKTPSLTLFARPEEFPRGVARILLQFPTTELSRKDIRRTNNSFF